MLFDGLDVTRCTPEERNIAQVFQFPVIYDTMTVAENLAFPLKNRGVDRATIDRRVAEIGEMLELTPLLRRRANGLTADLKQKISLGRGLVREDVAAILFDEPLTVIDPHLKWQLRTQLKRLHTQSRATMIYVTHDQTEALTFADTVVVMYDGEIVQIGPPEALFEQPEHTFVGYFIGSPGMNVLPAAVDGAAALVEGSTVALASRYKALPKAARIEIGVRPEHVRLTAKGEGLPVEVVRVDDIGRLKVAKLTLGGRPLAAVLPEDASLEGSSFRAVFDPARVHVYADGRRVAGEAA